jgi:glycosyltransferase involved in cell wall biosynthesis
MVCLYESPSFVLGWAWAKLAGVRVYLWCEATPELNRTGSRVRRMVKSFMFRHTNLILTPGRDADAFVTEFGGARARSRIRRLRHVIDYAHYSGKISDASSRHRLRDEWGVPDDETVFLCVGRFLEPKGTVHAVEAFSLLPPEVLAKSQLVLVGDGSDREQIVATIAEKGLGSRVKLVDFAQREELPGVYAAGDVLVFPTLGDTYGLVVDEALAAGLPVVASIHACEIAGRMAGNHHGLLADPRRTDDFARAMADMTTWDLSTAARHQRSRTVAQLTPELWARRLIAIVQDDLKGDRAISPVMRNVQEGEVSG